MKKIIAAVCILAMPCFAADDAPKQLCLEPSERIALAKSIVDKDKQIEEYKKTAGGIPVPIVIVIGLASAAVAAGVTVGVYELKK